MSDDDTSREEDKLDLSQQGIASRTPTKDSSGNDSNNQAAEADTGAGQLHTATEQAKDLDDETAPEAKLESHASDANWWRDHYENWGQTFLIRDIIFDSITKHSQTPPISRSTSPQRHAENGPVHKLNDSSEVEDREKKAAAYEQRAKEHDGTIEGVQNALTHREWARTWRQHAEDLKANQTGTHKDRELEELEARAKMHDELADWHEARAAAYMKLAQQLREGGSSTAIGSNEVPGGDAVNKPQSEAEPSLEQIRIGPEGVVGSMVTTYDDEKYKEAIVAAYIQNMDWKLRAHGYEKLVENRAALAKEIREVECPSEKDEFQQYLLEREAANHDLTAEHWQKMAALCAKREIASFTQLLKLRWTRCWLEGGYHCERTLEEPALKEPAQEEGSTPIVAFSPQRYRYLMDDYEHQLQYAPWSDKEFSHTVYLAVQAAVTREETGVDQSGCHNLQPAHEIESILDVNARPRQDQDPIKRMIWQVTPLTPAKSQDGDRNDDGAATTPRQSEMWQNNLIRRALSRKRAVEYFNDWHRHAEDSALVDIEQSMASYAMSEWCLCQGRKFAGKWENPPDYDLGLWTVETRDWYLNNAKKLEACIEKLQAQIANLKPRVSEEVRDVPWVNHPSPDTVKNPELLPPGMAIRMSYDIEADDSGRWDSTLFTFDL